MVFDIGTLIKNLICKLNCVSTCGVAQEDLEEIIEDIEELVEIVREELREH